MIRRSAAGLLLLAQANLFLWISLHHHEAPESAAELRPSVLLLDPPGWHILPTDYVAPLCLVCQLTRHTVARPRASGFRQSNPAQNTWRPVALAGRPDARPHTPHQGRAPPLS